MQQSYSAFKYYSRFLFKGDAPRGGGGLGVVWGGQPVLLLSEMVPQVGSLELPGLGL